MFCKYCGSELSDSANFCRNCGANLESKNPVAPQSGPIQNSGFYNQPPQPMPPSVHGKPAKSPGGSTILIILLTVLLVAGIGVNVLQFLNGTHVFAGQTAQRYTYKDPDASDIIQTEAWGTAPANQLLLVFEDQVGKAEAKTTIAQLGGVVVGELDTINLYQIEVQSRSEAELSALIDTALSLNGVESAFPNVELYGKGLEGTPCSPLTDPVFSDPNNAAHYKAIGMEDAWRIIKSSGISLNKVKAGVLDSAIYVGSGEFNGKVKLDGDQTSEPEKNDNNAVIDGGLNHGTMVTNVIGADHNNGGMVGIAAILEDKLSIKVKNLYDGKKTVPVAYDENDITQATLHKNGMDYTYTMKALVYLKEQVDSGATVINCSYGPALPREGNKWISEAYKKFFQEIYRTRPDVVFVAAAGNEGRDPVTNGALSGSNYFPAGMKLPNLVTVGALNNDGSRAEFSNYAGSDAAEVTLSAPGVDMVLGTDAQGHPIKASGTSFAAPQVTAAIALIQSINPGLDAVQIKELLIETASPAVTNEDGTNPIPPGMGSGILRVDEAVLRAINDQRYKEGKSPFTLRELLDMSTVQLAAEAGFREYTVTASVPDAQKDSVSLKIEITGDCSLDGEPVQTVSIGEEARWDLTLEEDSAFIRVIRTDNGTCAYMTLKIYESVAGVYEVSGSWEGSVLDGREALTDWRVRVDQSGSDMTVTFLNNSGTTLTGSYDESSGVFRGIDQSVPEDVFATTWWTQDYTTITFDFDSNPMRAKGSLGWDWAERTENHLFDWLEVDFEMVKVEDLPA